MYHDAEGGDIARLQTPIPGSNLPYPNLASVPASPAALSATEKQAVQQQLAAGPTPAPGAGVPASAQALNGLVLPAAPPPPPDVPGVNWQGLPQPAPALAPAMAPPPATLARPADGPPILLAFKPNSALLGADARAALTALAQSRGSATLRVAGFGGQNNSLAAAPDPAALRLALVRARRIADALTAAGVPADKITLLASAAGSGGFAQLVY